MNRRFDSVYFPTRYLTYSFLVHTLFLGWVTFKNLPKETNRSYYSVDFVGGLAPRETLQGESQKGKEQGEIKTQGVDPKENLLLKSKEKISKKDKGTRDLIPSVPSLPTPKHSKQIGGEVVPEVPHLGSGIGIGFGDGNFESGRGHFPYRWYIDSVKKRLDSNWDVVSGFDARIYTEVAFTINRNGSIEDVEIEKSSKNETFDRAVIRSVESSDPLPPLPSDFPDREIRVHVRFSRKR